MALAVYGVPPQELYAAVVAQVPNVPQQHDWSGLSETQLQQVVAQEQAAGFVPTIISATGSATAAVFAAVFEPGEGASMLRTGLRPGSADDPGSLEGAHAVARIQGLLPVSLAAYGDSGDPLLAAIWGPNPDKTLWNGNGVSERADAFAARQKAQLSGWCRPALLAVGADGRYSSVFTDDLPGACQAVVDLNTGAYQRALDQWTPQGLVPSALQVAGRDARDARFCAVFTPLTRPPGKTFSAAGPVANAEIDAVIAKFMQDQPLRQAALAIVHGTKLVYARGYTFAEPDWPPAQPTTLFRLASVSKTVTALALFQAIEDGKLHLGDRMQDILKLRTPGGGAPVDQRFGEITVQHLLEHTSGLNPDAFNNDIAVLKAHEAGRTGSWHLPVSAEMVDAFIASLRLEGGEDIQPGTEQVYNNCGHYLLGRILAKVRGTATPIEAMQRHLFEPLSITRIRRGRTLVADQLADEARYGASVTGKGDDARLDIPVFRSVMSDDRPLVPRGYGEEQYENKEGSGGLSGAVADLARLVAVWISADDTPALKRSTVVAMLNAGIATGRQYKLRAGYGLDGARQLSDGQYYGQKGGDLATSQNVLQFDGDWGFALNWASHLHAPEFKWYPDFPEVMKLARSTDWGDADLFPTFGMASL